MLRFTIKKTSSNCDMGKNEKLKFDYLDLDVPELEERLKQEMITQYGYDLYDVINVERMTIDN